MCEIEIVDGRQNRGWSQSLGSRLDFTLAGFWSLFCRVAASQKMETAMTRNEFIKLMAVGAASFLDLGHGASANQVRGAKVQWGRLKFLCANNNDLNWNVHPNGDLNLIDQLNEKSSVNLAKEWNVAEITNMEKMTEFPFLFMHAEAPPQLDDLVRKNMREYLLRGGFLYAEDCVIGSGTQGNKKTNDKFFLKMADELPQILPEAKFERLPIDHPLFEALFNMKAWPHMQGTPHGPWGLTLNGRLLALLSPSDLHCGWTNGARWFGAAKAEAALKMGTNIYIHAMTQNA